MLHFESFRIIFSKIRSFSLSHPPLSLYPDCTTNEKPNKASSLDPQTGVTIKLIPRGRRRARGWASRTFRHKVVWLLLILLPILCSAPELCAQFKNPLADTFTSQPPEGHPFVFQVDSSDSQPGRQASKQADRHRETF